MELMNIMFVIPLLWGMSCEDYLVLRVCRAGDCDNPKPLLLITPDPAARSAPSLVIPPDSAPRFLVLPDNRSSISLSVFSPDPVLRKNPSHW